MDYRRMKATADRLLHKNGMPVTLTRYESITGWTKGYDEIEMRDKWTDGDGNIVYTAPTGTPAAYIHDGIRTQFSNYEIDGTLIKKGDVKLVLSTDFPEPTHGDKFTVDGTVYNYVNHEEKNPAGTGLVYIVQVRK